MPPNRRIKTISDISSSHHEEVANHERLDKAASNRVASVPKGRTGLNPHLKKQTFSREPPYCQPATSTKTNPTTPTNIRLAHIPTLPLADVCQQTLLRIWKEFDPIIRRRGYHVRSISELCCCGDGLDHNSGGARKRRKMSNNVLGYNQTSFCSKAGQRRTSHTIHLRLRSPTNHTTSLLDWEDVAGTMAHELSHCIHQNHSPEFYKLMEEILEEHATNQIETTMNGFGQSSRTPLTTAVLPTTGGHRLGGDKAASNGKSRLLEEHARKEATGHRLGGGQLPFDRREAMARAAEKRKQYMERLKRMIEKSKEPCVIEILEDDENTEMDQQKKRDRTISVSPAPKIGKRKLPSKTTARSSKLPALNPPTDVLSEVIDLTSPGMKVPAVRNVPAIEWECHRCTFLNAPLALVCEMCVTERP